METPIIFDEAAEISPEAYDLLTTHAFEMKNHAYWGVPPIKRIIPHLLEIICHPDNSASYFGSV
jgi:hypothetical protein